MIKSHGSCTPYEIKSELDKEAKEIAIHQYEKGKIDEEGKNKFLKIIPLEEKQFKEN